MKVICDIRGWEYPKGARATDLLKVFRREALFPEFADQSFEQLIATLKSGLPVLRNQSGGHGQFGDVHVEIKPLPRGTGFEFVDNVVGGSVPRQYISSVEEGAREFLHRGPLGFPVVDVSVTLYDGQYHTVDSSDMAFKTAARIAMSEGMPKCEPVLLEPICSVQITIPNDFTARVHGLISGRRGQILGFSAKEGWQGWDEVNAYLPQSELHDLIIELRSLTMGVGTFSWKFDHLQELTGRLADKIVEHRLTAAH